MLSFHRAIDYRLPHNYTIGAVWLRGHPHLALDSWLSVSVCCLVFTRPLLTKSQKYCESEVRSCIDLKIQVIGAESFTLLATLRRT